MYYLFLKIITIKCCIFYVLYIYEPLYPIKYAHSDSIICNIKARKDYICLYKRCSYFSMISIELIYHFLLN